MGMLLVTIIYFKYFAGLASYLFTESMSRAWRVAEALEYGLVGVNEGIISTEVKFLNEKI